MTSSLQILQGYCSVIEGRQVDIQAVFKCNIKKYKSKTKKRKETNSAQHKAKYVSLFKSGHEKSSSSAYLVYLLMYVSSVFVAKLNVIMMMIIIKIMIVIDVIIVIVTIIITILLMLVMLLIIMIITIKK